MSVRVHVIRNGAATGKTRRDAHSVLSALRSAGHKIVDLSAPTAAAASDRLRHAIDAGEVEQLVIAGGDGLVHLAIQHLAQTNIAVTLAPVGTGNDFATAITERLATRTDTATNQHGDDPFAVDLIRVTSPNQDPQWVASVAIAGFPADINARANQMSRKWGSNVYVLATAKELPGYTRRTIELSIDDIPITTDTAMLAVGNTKYFGGGMVPCPDALPDDGLLHFTSIEKVDRIGLAPHLLGRTGGTEGRKEVLRGDGTCVEIHSPGHDFWADGEPISASPLSFEIIPKALLIKEVLPFDT